MQGHHVDGLGFTPKCFASDVTSSPYDTVALKERADQWRVEAAKVTTEAMRVFCLNEAERCERRLQRSLSTPVIRDWVTAEPWRE